MEELAEYWEKRAEKYRKLAREADDHPMRQEGLYASSEVYSVCASDLIRKLKENAK